MKHKLTKSTVLLVLAALMAGLVLPATAAAQLTEHTISFGQDDLAFSQVEGGDGVMYDVVEASFGGNVCGLEGETGSPALPVCDVQVLLPDGADGSALEASVGGEIALDGAYNVVPAQPSYPLSEEAPPFAPPDPGVYASSSPMPGRVAELVDTVVVRGYHLALVRVYPLVYVPATGQLSLRTDITLRLSEGRAAATLSYQGIDPTFEQFVAGSVINPQDMAAGYGRAAVGSPSDPNDVKYLLITDASLMDEFQPLVDWKTKKGVPAEAVSVDWVYSNYSGSTNQRKIKECIKDYVQNKGTVWVALAGDSNIIPDYDCYVSAEGYTDSTNPTDLYYAGLDDMDWNDDGDSRACETSDSIDMGPDVFVGRLSVRTASEATAIVNKTLAYEKNLPASNFAKKMILVGIKLWNTGDAEAKSELMYNDYIKPYWNGTRYRFYDTATDFGGSSYNVTIANMNQQIVNGYNHFHMATHGNTSIWGMESGSSYSSSDAQSVNNPGKYTNIVTIACITNAFDREVALSEGFIRNSNGGAVTYIGGSRYGWGIGTMNTHGASFQYNRQYYKYLFNGEPAGYAQQVGAVFAKAKEYWSGSSGSYDTMRWVQFSLNLMGDPELSLYTQDPSTLSPSYAGSISTGSQTYAVETGVANALVCLSKGSEVYAYGRANGSGRFETTINPASTGTMDVTVTAPNYDPHEGTVSVSGGTPPPPPSDLAATAVSDVRIDLSWTDNSSDEDAFEIQRKTGSGSFTTVATVGANVTAYSDTGLTPETTYTYRVRALRGGSSSTWSNEGSATTQSPTPPNPPSNLQAQAVSSSGINLSWTDNSGDEDTFEIQRKTGGGTFATIATVGANVTAYSDAGLTPETTYTYRVRALKGSTSSTWSNEGSATTESGPVIVFEDDFETDKGWSSAGGTATTGQFERANPEGTSYSGVDYQLGTTPSGSYDLVTEGSAGSSVGSYDIDGGDTKFRSPDIALPASGDITLSFNYYLAHYSNASSDDYFRVKVVGATTETVLEELGTGSIKGAAWQSAEVSLNAFAGQTVYLLVEAADGGSGSLVEAAFDDVLITGASVEPPVAPTDLAATAVAEDQIDLTWQDNSTDEDSFDIQRKTGSGSFATIATVGANVTGYSDTGLTPDTTYTYRVRAVNGSLTSGWSNENSATTLPPEPPVAPSDLAAGAVSQTQIDLSWTDNSDDEDSFEIQRKTGSGSFSTIATVGAGVTGYNDTGLTPGTTYTYRVRALKGSLSSGWSNEDSATTPTGPVFEDDFETDKGWSSAGGTATTGLFERANPEGTSYSGVDYQLGNAASGSYDLVTEGSAGSSVGANDIDGGDTKFRSPDIVLPNQSGLTLSFQYYLAHYSNASSDDYLRVKVVGSTTQTVLEVLGTGTIKGGAWQTATVNLDAFAGQTVYLLVEAADGGSGSLVEAGLDDVLIE